MACHDPLFNRTVAGTETSCYLQPEKYVTTVHVIVVPGVFIRDPRELNSMTGVFL